MWHCARATRSRARSGRKNNKQQKTISSPNFLVMVATVVALLLLVVSAECFSPATVHRRADRRPCVNAFVVNSNSNGLRSRGGRHQYQSRLFAMEEGMDQRLRGIQRSFNEMTERLADPDVINDPKLLRKVSRHIACISFLFLPSLSSSPSSSRPSHHLTPRSPRRRRENITNRSCPRGPSRRISCLPTLPIRSTALTSRLPRS